MKNFGPGLLAAMILLFLPACEIVSSGLDQEPLSEEESLALPMPTGPFRVGATSLFIADADRDDEYTPEADVRELNVQVWYPADQEGFAAAAYMNPTVAELLAVTQDYMDPTELTALLPAVETHTRIGAPVATSAGRLPVVFLSHGLGGVASLYSGFAVEMASHGYLVVGIDHTYGAFASVFPDGRIRSIRASAAPPFPTMVNIWAKDMISVLDHLETLDTNDPAALLTGRLDLSNVAAMGHSTGGSASAEVLIIDPRFTAGITWDAPQVGPAAEGDGVDDPLMLFFAEQSQYAGSAVADRLQAPGFSLTVRGMTHYSFTDLPYLLEAAGVGVEARNDSNRPTGTLSGDRNNKILLDWSLAFLDRYLRGAPGTLLDGSGGQYPEVTARRVGLVGVAAF